MNEFEVLNRPLKLGDIVSATGEYKSYVYLYVVVGFANKSVRLCPLNKKKYNNATTVKAQVALIPDAQQHLTDALRTWYEKICQDNNITIS